MSCCEIADGVSPTDLGRGRDTAAERNFAEQAQPADVERIAGIGHKLNLRHCQELR